MFAYQLEPCITCGKLSEQHDNESHDFITEDEM